MILRDYQKDCVQSLFKSLCTQDSALAVLYTGAGKTEIFISIIKEMLERKSHLRVCVLLNKIKLLDQTVKRVKKVINNVSVFCGSLNEKCLNENVVIASIQSISKIDSHFDLVIIDEAHRISEQYLTFFDKCKGVNHKCKFLGFTATPFINNEKIYGKDKFFKKIDFNLSITYGLENNWLCPPIIKKTKHQIDTSKFQTVRGDFDFQQVDNEVLNKEIADNQVCDALNYIENDQRKKIIWFCHSIKHAELVSELLLKYGEDNCVYHSELSSNERKLAEEKFETTECRHLVFITIVAEGYDFAPCDCVVLLRPTKSPTLFIQVVGRVLRLAEGKTHSLVLDYGQCIKNCGPIDAPFLIKKRGEKKDGEALFKLCPACDTLNKIQMKICIDCGYEWPIVKNKELTMRPESEYGILSNDYRKITDIKEITLKLHTSKANNKCFCLSYIYSEFNSTYGRYYHNSISEYFRLDVTFALNKFIKRSNELNFKLYETTIETIENFNVERLPKTIFVQDKGNYTEIIKLQF